MDMDPWNEPPRAPTIDQALAAVALDFGGSMKQESSQPPPGDPWGIPQQKEQRNPLDTEDIEELRDKLYDIQYICENWDTFSDAEALAGHVLNIIKYG